jgi:DNA-directed RNA polymerase specialized sigma subunit
MSKNYAKPNAKASAMVTREVAACKVFTEEQKAEHVRRANRKISEESKLHARLRREIEDRKIARELGLTLEEAIS